MSRKGKPRWRVSMDWQEGAACAGMGVGRFFPDDRGPGQNHREQAAKKICASCPVQAECLAYGMADRFGIFGGLTAEERNEVRRRSLTVASRTDRVPVA